MSRNEDKCYECSYTPNYHSFHLLSENDDECYYYTCPAEAKTYNDPDGFIHHIEVELRKKRKPWVWIINGEAFGLTHIWCSKMHSKILQLATDYAKLDLINIIVIRQNITFKMLLNSSWYLIDKSLRKKIVIDKTNSFSELLNIDTKLLQLHESLYY